MINLASVEIVVYGLVQGVFFRAFVQRQANQLSLTGYVRNLASGESVEVHAEGKRKQLEKLICCLRTGPRGAKVEQVVTNWSEFTGNYSLFSIKY